MRYADTSDGRSPTRDRTHVIPAGQSWGMPRPSMSLSAIAIVADSSPASCITMAHTSDGLASCLMIKGPFCNIRPRFLHGNRPAGQEQALPKDSNF